MEAHFSEITDYLCCVPVVMKRMLAVVGTPMRWLSGVCVFLSL